MSTTYNDGSAAAPAGSPNLPNLLAGYAKRPPWEVAGVDYAVGVPSGLTLLDPSTINMAGVSVNTSSHLITITGSNVTLNGYNFGADGGWAISSASGAANTVIENCNFTIDAANNVPINVSGGGNLTVLDCTFNGNGTTNGTAWAMLNYAGSGTLVAKYNIFENLPADAIDMGSGSLTSTIEYNLFTNIGTAPGSHADTVQFDGTDSTNSVIAFNTITSGEEGIQLAAQGGSTLTNTKIENNVIVAQGPSVTISYSIAVQQGSGNTINGVVVDDNYIDATGSYGPFYPPSGTNLTFSGNVNMSTGAAIASPSGAKSTDVTSVTATPASATETAGSTVTLTLSMDEPEIVAGTPTLTLNDGGTAAYASGSGTSTLVFKTTITSADEAVSALAITGVGLSSGASIDDLNGNAANLAGAVATFTGLSLNPGSSSSAAKSPPDAVADTALTPEDEAVTIAVLANDTDSVGTINPASVVVRTAAAHGTTTVNSTTGAITYTPASGYYGTDTFQYTVADTLGDTSAPATVTVTVDAPPDPTAETAATPENQAVTINVLADDTDPDGTINPASVAITTAAGHGTTTVNPTTGAITYTPSNGYSGTDTFQYTVADTLGVRSAPGTVTVTVSPTASVSSGAGGSGYVDGSAGAPSGTPQLPTILSGYAVRPSWEVAGVDYAVGIPSGTTLKDPGTITMAGVTVNTTAHTVTITGSGVTLSGYDFSLHNGYTVIVEGANDTIENSNFVVGTNQGSGGNVLDVTTAASNFSLIGNDINGNNVAVTPESGSTVSIASSGSLIIQYNYFHNSGGDMVDLGRSTTPEIDIIQYNLFENIGVNTAHADTIQWYNTQIGAGSDVGFNTVYQNVAQPGAGNGGLVALSEGPQSTMTGLTINNDTVIQTAAGTSNFTIGFEADSGGTASDIVIHDLYIDPTGAANYTGSPWFPTGYYDIDLASPTVMSNVINMVTGGQVTVPSASDPTSQGYYVYPDANGYSPDLSDVSSIKSSITSGTLDVGNTVTFTVNLDEDFTVTGAPTLILNDGGTATYAGGSGTSSLTFAYTVAASNTSVSKLAVTGAGLPNGATVKDSVGNEANLAGVAASFTGLATDPADPVSQTYTLTAGTDSVSGGAGQNTVLATNDTLSSGDDINAGSSGDNLLMLQGAGTFDLRAPSTLTGIQTVDAEGATASQTQLIYLRNGLNVALDILDSGTVDLFGATNSDIINLGSGPATVSLGSDNETVHGGEGNETFIVDAATAGATIAAGSGANMLQVTGGGTVVSGPLTNVQNVILNAATTAYDFVAGVATTTIHDTLSGDDTVVAGSSLQTIDGHSGHLTVQATVVNAGVEVNAGTGGATLDITNSGTVTVGAGDNDVVVQLTTADTLVLPTNTLTSVQGSAAGDDTFLATNGVLRDGQTIVAAGLGNTLVAQGAGAFYLSQPATLSGLQAVDLTGAAAGQSQFLFLRAGLNLTVNVQDPGAVWLQGAANNDIINLGSGTANVTLGGSGEMVNGGSGGATFNVTGATAGATIHGGTGANVLQVTGGGTVTLGGDSGIQNVFLNTATTAYDFTADSAAANMVIHVSLGGTDTVVVGAASQSVYGYNGALTVDASAANAGAFVRTGSGGASLNITTGGTAVLNASDSNLTVQLSAATNLSLGPLAFITAIGAAGASSTITAGGAHQTLESIGGQDTLVGAASFGDTFLGTSAGLTGDTIKGFGGSDLIDITDMVSPSVQPYVFNAATSQLTVTDGSHSVTLHLAGSYSAASFAAPVSDGQSGTLIKFQ